MRGFGFHTLFLYKNGFCIFAESQKSVEYKISLFFDPKCYNTKEAMRKQGNFSLLFDRKCYSVKNLMRNRKVSSPEECRSFIDI